MSSRLVELALKKQRLQIRSAALRAELLATAVAWTPAFALADRGRAVVQWLRHHPLLPVTVVAALLVARPRTVLRWAQRGFLVWQALGKIRGVLQLALSRSR